MKLSFSLCLTKSLIVLGTDGVLTGGKDMNEYFDFARTV